MNSGHNKHSNKQTKHNHQHIKHQNKQHKHHKQFKCMVQHPFKKTKNCTRGSGQEKTTSNNQRLQLSYHTRSLYDTTPMTPTC